MKTETAAVFEELFRRYPVLAEVEAGILQAYTLILDCFNAGGKLLVCGNGGSAADSEHIAGELLKGFKSRRPLGAEQREKFYKAFPDDAEYLCAHLQQGLPAISLVSQCGIISSFANDVAADMVYAQQLFAYHRPGDVLLALTTSGASKNIIQALKTAKAIGMSSILLAGSRHPENAALSSASIFVPETETYKVQELHLPVYHALCAAIEAEIF